MSSGYRRSTSYASVAAGTADPAAASFSLGYTSGETARYEPAPASDSSSDQDISRPQSRRREVERRDPMIMDEAATTSLWSATEFFTPSYLRGSRYLERLKRAHTRRQSSSVKDPRQGHAISTGLGSRQQSSSNLTQHKSTTSRTVVHDLVERVAPSVQEDNPRPLPSKWSEVDRCQALEITGNGLEVKHQGASRTADDAATVRSQHPIPKDVGIYYYEVTVTSRGKDGLIGVGFSSQKSNLSRLPGWELESWGYHGDDGCSFDCSTNGKPYGPKFSASDTVGCGINFRTSTAFFTKNGTFLGDAFHAVKTHVLYPSVGIKKPGEQLRVNFGHTPFIFDIDTFVERERRMIRAEIDQTDVSRTSLYNDLDETSTIQQLITQYLAHEGFLETATSFARDVAEQSAVLGNNASALGPDDMEAAHRQKIRAAILEGNIDRAFKYLGAYFPRVMETEINRDIYFRLRCRKFIEMILRSYELQNSINQDEKAHGEGATLDQRDQLNGASTDGPEFNPPQVADPMETSTDNLADLPAFADTKTSSMLANELLTSAIQYGMELQGEFKHDTRKEVKETLSDTFALIAYTDARDSALAEMMEGRGRAEIAEQVNGAILVSLGKPRSALIEKLCGQTEVLLDVLSEGGRAGSLVNLQRDYLQ